MHEEPGMMKESRPPRRRQLANPLQAGILAFIGIHDSTQHLEAGAIPKRYTRYGSLLLLGPTFATHSDSWAALFGSLTTTDRGSLFHTIIDAFQDSSLTHVALNAPIAPITINGSSKEENIVRSPTGLLPLFGDFGPGTGQCDPQHPKKSDLDHAYWTNTEQLNGITQVWAPRWTMFSRGNVSEKARILQGGLSKSPFPGLNESELEQQVNEIDVVDFYIGIGYFAFCYLSRGAARVWGWEINGWSVEGLRRGCSKNGWGVRVVKIDHQGEISDGSNLEDLVADVNRLEGCIDAIRCIVFYGDNKWAGKIMDEIKSLMGSGKKENALSVRHCNLGLLPSSEKSWECAVQTLDWVRGGWLHVHENVDLSAIHQKQQYILEKLAQIAQDKDRKSWSMECAHVEVVKTYAPGVVHCVYDIKLYPSR